MKLYYHNDSNFGDALNPLLFDILLPGFFDNNPEDYLIGIGSILGVFKLPKITKRLFIFSSGYAYGEVPSWKNIEVNCLAVRGPLTAQKMGFDAKKAITDGGVLTDFLLDKTAMNLPKKYKYAYMPHHYSLEKYKDYETVCAKMGIKLIDPVISPNNSIVDITKEIHQTEILITEALHGAIVAEAFRVPYIPVKAYQHINEFKWQDFGTSLDIDLTLNQVPALYSKDFLTNKITQKTKLPKSMNGLVYNSLKTVGFFNENKFIKRIEALIKVNEVKLSKDSKIKERREQLLEKVDQLKHSL